MASGGYAERAVANVASLHARPDGLAADVAVAMIGTGRTTLAVLEVGDLRADDVVLVTAAAGGMGSLLVQAGRNAGATVAVAGGEAKLETTRRLGATIAIDYIQPDWTDAVRKALDGREVTVAFDGVGGDLGRGALELLGAGGRFILYGYSTGTPTQLTSGDLFSRGISASAAIGPRIMKRPGGLRDLETRALTEAAAGRLVPLIGPPFRLADAPAAHRAIETRATMGKTVLIP